MSKAEIYLDIAQSAGRLGMTMVLLCSGAYWLFHSQWELGLLAGILMSLIEMEGHLDRASKP